MSYHDRTRLLSANTQKTYSSRLRKIGHGQSVEEVVEAVHVAVEGVPRGTFLPTRAAALHWLVGELRLSYAEAQALLPSGRNAKTTSLRRAMTAAQQVQYFNLVERMQLGPVRTILLLLPQLGLRVSEILHLERRHVRLDGDGFVLEVHGKSKEPRLVPVAGDAAADLGEYLQAAQPRSLLFPGRSGAPLTEQAVRRFVTGYSGRKGRVPGIGDRIGVPRLKIHELRHTFASHALEEQVDLFHLAELLGHSSLETTRAYLHTQLDHKRTIMARLARKRRS